jgi:pimeloyl-ACP methyl ester carboxylesterase
MQAEYPGPTVRKADNRMHVVSRSIPAPGGGTLWVERDGSGTPVVLLHGAGMDSRLWDRVFPQLARYHAVIRYDARGLGRSTPPDQPYWDVEDLGAVLAYFSIDRAALVGLSMGGETALDFTLTHPERVTALALIGTSVSGYTWPDTPELAAYAAARRQGNATRLAELELSLWAPMGPTAPAGELVATMVHDNAQRRIVSERLARYPSTVAMTRIDQINTPTLIIHGNHDHPEIASIADLLAANIPGARSETVTGADHYLPLRTPEQLTALLLGRVSKAWGSPSCEPGRVAIRPDIRGISGGSDDHPDPCVAGLALLKQALAHLHQPPRTQPTSSTHQPTHNS